jgi:hypothetical protein
MTLKKGTDNAAKRCGNKFESVRTAGPERTVYGLIVDEEDGTAGFNKVIRTVSRADHMKTTGKIPTPCAA